MSINDRLLAAAGMCAGWGHSFPDPKVPMRVGSIPQSVVTDESPAVTNCSTFCAFGLMYAYPEIDWDLDDYKHLQVWFPDLKWSAVERAADLVGGVVLHGELRPGPWHLVQGWEPGGHQCFARTLLDGRVETLEARLRHGVVRQRFEAATFTRRWEEWRAVPLP